MSEDFDNFKVSDKVTDKTADLTDRTQDTARVQQRAQQLVQAYQDPKAAAALLAAADPSGEEFQQFLVKATKKDIVQKIDDIKVEAEASKIANVQIQNTLKRAETNKDFETLTT